MANNQSSQGQGGQGQGGQGQRGQGQGGQGQGGQRQGDQGQGNQGQSDQDEEDEQNQGDGRGFAGMDDDKQREIASEGGRAAHERGTAHEFTPEEARDAGRKGGESRGQSDDNQGRGGQGSQGGNR